MNVLFACGAPKSGTTWLQRVLDAHPEVMCSGEGHFIDRFTLPLAQVVKDYNEQVKLVGHRVYEGKPYYAPLSQQDFDDMGRAFIMSRLMSRGPGPEVRWVGDKTPRYTLNLGSLNRLFPSCRFVNIVRDPRDGLMSRLGHAIRAGFPEAGQVGSAKRRDIINLAATDWVKNVAPIVEFQTAMPGRMHSLRYEDLLAKPVEETSAIFEFLGVSTAPQVIADVVARTSFEAQSGRKAGEEDPKSFLRKGVAGDWIGRLEPEAVAQIGDICGDLMRRYGYA